MNGTGGAAASTATAASAASAGSSVDVKSSSGVEFVSEWMELRSAGAAGKGWFAKKAIPAGTALMFERGLWSIPYLPSKPEQKASALDDLTVKFCVAETKFGCNELSFTRTELPAGAQTTASDGTPLLTASGAPFVASPYPAQYSDTVWSEARARIKTNAFQQISTTLCACSGGGSG